MAGERALRPVDIPRSSELISDRLKIEGGRPLEGRIRLQGAKNLALQAITASILTNGDLTLVNVPRIEDVEVTLSILENMGAAVRWRDNRTLTCNCSNLRFFQIDPRESLKSTGTRYFIPVLTRRYGLMQTGPSGGDQLGASDRGHFTKEMLSSYERIGIGHNQSAFGMKYEFFPLAYLSDRELKLEERYFGPTVQALLFHAKGEAGQGFVIRNPCIEPEIFETVKLLNSMGAVIYYDERGRDKGEDFIYIASRPRLAGVEFRIMSDPNALVSYAVMGLITNGHVVIENIDYSDKVGAFLEILSSMEADFSYDEKEGSLKLAPSMSRLKSLNLVTNFWPAQCHTDWQQILTPLLASLKGESYIDENVHPQRFTTFEPLTKMGARLEKIKQPDRIKRLAFKQDGKPHTLKISGPAKFRGAAVDKMVDIRGTTGVLAAMLSANGKSVLEGVDQLERGMENIVSNLRSLGACVSLK